jgi:hypothetical protein
MLKLQHAAVSDINDARDRMASRRGAMAAELTLEPAGKGFELLGTSVFRI